MDWSSIRADFPILDQQVQDHPLVYFDSAATSQKPNCVIDALTDFYRTDNANVHRGLHELSMRSTVRFEAARRRIAAFIGAADHSEIIFTRGATEAVNLVAQVWAGQFFKPGDVILVTGMEHHSNLVPWQLAAQQSGATLRHVPVLDDGTLDFETLDDLLTPQVKLFAFTHISNSLGTINPVAEMCAKARAVGAATLIDGAQAAGHVPVNVGEIGCDFYALSGHKMCGPTGIGVLFGRSDRLNAMQPWHGGGEMIVSVSLESSTFKPPPHRFEAGTPDFAGAIALAAAIDYLDQIGLDAIQQHGDELTAHAMLRLSELPGLRIVGPPHGVPRGSLVAFTLDCAHPHDLVEFANSHGLAMRGGHHCTQPLMKRFKVPGTTRASFYLYNTRAEVDRMIDILKQAVTFFA